MIQTFEDHINEYFAARNLTFVIKNSAEKPNAAHYDIIHNENILTSFDLIELIDAFRESKISSAQVLESIILFLIDNIEHELQR